jgi:arylsulfatase A-like enzyme/Flp pilus assembly protein TadD
MNIRRALGWAILTIGAVVLLVAATLALRDRWPGGGGSIRPARDHDLLLVTLDTTRADRLGCYGGDPGVTPNLDGLAAGGIVFEDVTATAPITLPAHASMLTGLYPLNHGIRNNGMFSLTEDRQTLAEVLSSRGYATGAFVSAAVLARRYGLDRGFEVYDDDISQGRSSSRHSVPERRGDLTVAAAEAWLRSVPEDRPFFCWVHLYDPHAPYDPPPEFRRRFPGDPYTGEIAFADALVGRLLAALDASGRLPRAVVSVAADHGEGLGEHGEQTHAILLHQATVHVPWILAAVNLPRSTRVSAPVSGADIGPTLAALVGARVPNRDTADGRSVLPLLLGKRTDGHDRLLWTETLLPRYQYGWSPLYAVRMDRWKLVHGRRRELYDVRRDPRELADVAANERAVVDSLDTHLRALADDAPAEGGGDAKLDLSRSEIEKLQALGYLGTDAAQRPDPPDPRDLITAHVHMERARNMFQRGLLDDAIAELDRMLTDDPGNVSGLSLRGQVLMQQGRFDEARHTLDRLLVIDPENATAYAMMARLELARGAPDRALTLAELGAGQRGAFETLSALQAEALIALGRRDDAVALLSSRLQDRPHDPDLLVAMARLRLRAGDTASAEAMLRGAVEADGLHTPANLALANLLDESNRGDEATRVLEALLQIDPGHPAALAALGRIRLDDPARARPYLEEAVRLNPSRFEPHVSLGVCYLKLGLPDKAEASLRRALALQPDDLRTRNNLGIALYLQRRSDEAEQVLRGILAEAPDFAEAQNNLALVLHGQNRIDEAERAARDALRLDPELRDASLSLATILHDQGRYREEVEVLGPLHDRNPEALDVAARLGVALESAGDCDGATPLLESALVAFPNEPRLMTASARCAERLGDIRRAVQLYERIAQIAPEGTLRNDALAAIERLSR